MIKLNSPYDDWVNPPRPTLMHCIGALIIVILTCLLMFLWQLNI